NQQTDWRIAADYRISDSFMLYGQVATGYRAIGFNPRSYFPSQMSPHVPDTIASYEVGFETDFRHRRERLHTATSHLEYHDIVLLSRSRVDLEPLNQATPCIRPSNAGSAKVKGLEAELFVNQDEGLTFDGSISYLEFEYKELDPTAGNDVTLNDITPF